MNLISTPSNIWHRFQGELFTTLPQEVDPRASRFCHAIPLRGDSNRRGNVTSTGLAAPENLKISVYWALHPENGIDGRIAGKFNQKWIRQISHTLKRPRRLWLGQERRKELRPGVDRASTADVSRAEPGSCE